MHPVCSLSWNRNGKLLLSASTDNTVCVFDMINGDCVRKFVFPSPFIKVQFHPRDNSMFLITLLKYPSLLVDLNGNYYELPLDDPNEPNVISSFDRRGEHVYCGNGKGKVLNVANEENIFYECQFVLCLDLRIPNFNSRTCNFIQSNKWICFFISYQTNRIC